MHNPILTLAEAIHQKRPAVLETAVEVKGTSPAKVGAQIVLLGDGTTAGKVGGGILEATILEDTRLALRTPTHFVGMISSRAECSTILAHLKAEGAYSDSLKYVYAPIGLDLRGTTPEEIAVAILVEVIAVRRGGTGEILSRTTKFISKVE